MWRHITSLLFTSQKQSHFCAIFLLSVRPRIHFSSAFLGHVLRPFGEPISDFTHHPRSDVWCVLQELVVGAVQKDQCLVRRRHAVDQRLTVVWVGGWWGHWRGRVAVVVVPMVIAVVRGHCIGGLLVPGRWKGGRVRERVRGGMWGERWKGGRGRSAVLLPGRKAGATRGCIET